MKYFLLLIFFLFMFCIPSTIKCPCENNIERIEYELNDHKTLPSYERIKLLEFEIRSIKIEDSLEWINK
jgi:hypothetical protein